MWLYHIAAACIAPHTINIVLMLFRYFFSFLLLRTSMLKHTLNGNNSVLSILLANLQSNKEKKDEKNTHTVDHVTNSLFIKMKSKRMLFGCNYAMSSTRRRLKGIHFNGSFQRFNAKPSKKRRFDLSESLPLRLPIEN